MHKNDTPWVMIIWDAYYSDGIPPHAKPSTGFFWWRGVFSLMDVYRGITTCVPAAGDTVLLWKDVWLGEQPLMNIHEHLFSFATNEDISLAQFYNNSLLEDNFMLPLSLEARTELDNLQATLAGILLAQMATDEWILCWGTQNTNQKSFMTSCSGMCKHLKS